MFAIIRTGGKQVKVEIGSEIYVEEISREANDKVTFEEVLMIDGQLGDPIVKDGIVKGTVIKQGKGKKLRVVRYHPKKNIRKVYGHRQPYTKVRIDEISIAKNKVVKEKVTKEVPSATTKTAKTKPAVKSEGK